MYAPARTFLSLGRHRKLCRDGESTKESYSWDTEQVELGNSELWAALSVQAVFEKRRFGTRVLWGSETLW